MYGRYAELLAEWWALQLSIRKTGRTYKARGKNNQIVGIVLRPEVKLRNTISVELRRMESEMGLTPAARERLTAEIRTAEAAEGKARFFGGQAAG
jgi:P27 family predicted phage terminase small subunit